jgi:hypothetical protein
VLTFRLCVVHCLPSAIRLEEYIASALGDYTLRSTNANFNFGRWRWHAIILSLLVTSAATSSSSVTAVAARFLRGRR